MARPWPGWRPLLTAATAPAGFLAIALAPLPFGDLLGWSPPPWAVIAVFAGLLAWILGFSGVLGGRYGVPESLPFRPARSDVVLRAMKWSAGAAAAVFFVAVALLFAVAPFVAERVVRGAPPGATRSRP